MDDAFLQRSVSTAQGQPDFWCATTAKSNILVGFCMRVERDLSTCRAFTVGQNKHSENYFI